jgi:plastocyanin
MRLRVAITAAVVAALGAGVEGALASADGAGGTVKAEDSVTFKINRYIQDGARFVPGTVRVASGSTLRFTYAHTAEEPHTLTIVSSSQLPRTVAQVENCLPCQRLAAAHLRNPKAPPDEKNPIVRWTLNKGRPGLDEVGDSLAIQPGAHTSISAVVSAASGTTLYFLCAVHPWMQGRIVVR